MAVSSRNGTLFLSCSSRFLIIISLKKLGKVDLCLTANEQELLQAIKTFLNDFQKFTELVSSSVPVLSIVPLMKVKIRRICQEEEQDEDAIKDLKRLILQNVDNSENEFMKLNLTNLRCLTL